MGMVEVGFEGGKEAADLLGGALADRAARVLGKGTMAGGALIADAAAAMAPRGATGTLGEEIIVSRTRQPSGGLSDVVGTLSKDESVVFIGPSTDAFYGKFQEFGTSRHAPQPFMRPAADEKFQAAAQAVADRIRNALG